MIEETMDTASTSAAMWTSSEGHQTRYSRPDDYDQLAKYARRIFFSDAEVRNYKVKVGDFAGLDLQRERFQPCHNVFRKYNGPNRPIPCIGG